MKISVIGGGVSSCIFAYQVKKTHPNYEVVIFEASDKLLKRVLVSGNGRANFFNDGFINGDISENFNYPEEFKRLFCKDEASEFLSILKDQMGFYYYTDSSKRMYPFANLSSSLKDTLQDNLYKVGVKVNLNSRVLNIDKNHKEITVNNKAYPYDKLFIGIGGSSFDRKPSDNISLLKNLDLNYVKPEPALCPLYVSNRIPPYLEGTRLKGRLDLLKDKKVIYTEDGELLFKKGGISGICVFDASLFIQSGNYEVSFDPFIHDGIKITDSDLRNLEGILPASFNKFIFENHLKSVTTESIKKLLTFKVKDKYSLRESQISLGGVSSEQINEDFTLKNNKDIILGGEVINLHAICGGFNMGWAFISGLTGAKHIN